jgi:hypothetical protein
MAIALDIFSCAVCATSVQMEVVRRRLVPKTTSKLILFLLKLYYTTNLELITTPATMASQHLDAEANPADPEVENPPQPAHLPMPSLFACMMSEASLLLRWQHTANGDRIRRGDDLRTKGAALAERRYATRRTSTGEEDWNAYNAHLDDIALANVTGHDGGADKLSRAEINNFGGKATLTSCKHALCATES